MICGSPGEKLVVVASKGGAPAHPAWYLNLVEHPDVDVQVRGEKFRAHARTAAAEEAPELWTLMSSIWPAYDEYTQKTGREIPLVVLERA